MVVSDDDLKREFEGVSDAPLPTSPHNCCCCPSEVRNLYATAHNLLVRIDNPTSIDWISFHNKANELREAVAKIRPLITTHFIETEKEKSTP